MTLSALEKAQRLLLPIRRQVSAVPALTATSLAAALLTSLYAVNHISTANLEKRRKKNDTESESCSKRIGFQLHVDFIEKLAQKPYLHFSSSPTDNPTNARPPGVPDNLRILVVDLPEIAQFGFAPDNSCDLVRQRVYVNGTAPPTKVQFDVSEGNNVVSASHDRKGPSKLLPKKAPSSVQVDVEQKTWVHALYHCMNRNSNRVGAQVMEASTARLNPHNIRRTHTYFGRNYDPGKYEEDKSPKTARDKTKPPDTPRTSRRHWEEQDDDHNQEISVLEAPWHQYAWREELVLRISGMVGFGEPMTSAERKTWRWPFLGGSSSSSQDQQQHGNVYRSTVPSLASPLWKRMLFFWRPQKDPAGLDGDSNSYNRASNKPHAVIANGLLLQRERQALRLLQKTCAQNDVPLFVIRDPRSWSEFRSMDESSLVTDDEDTDADEDEVGNVLRQVRKEVKRRIVKNSLQHSAGTAFARGIALGRLQAHSAYQSKEWIRKAKAAVREARAGSPVVEDWSKLNETDLEERLKAYRVLLSGTDTEEEGVKEGSGEDVAGLSSTKAFLSLAKKLANQTPEKSSNDD